MYVGDGVSGSRVNATLHRNEKKSSSLLNLVDIYIVLNIIQGLRLMYLNKNVPIEAVCLNFFFPLLYELFHMGFVIINK